MTNLAQLSIRTVQGNNGAFPFIALGVVFIALVLAWYWLKTMRRKRLIEDVPTSKVKGVAIGLSEVKGAARRDEPFISYLAGAPTVWYRYDISEHWERTVTETYTDSDGKRKTRTKRESGWKTVQSDEVRLPFDLEDETGAIRVDPARAEIQGRVIFDERCSRGDALYYGKGPPGSVSDSTGRRSFTEHAIVIDDPLYVMGSARLREDVVAAEIAYDPDDPMFLISVHDESKIASGYGVKALFLGLFGVLLCFGAAAFIASSVRQVSFGDPAALIPGGLAALGYALLLLLLYAVLLYNGLVRVRERIGKSWALIEVQLKRRADLVPRLASVVKGYADHEREVQEKLSAMRSGQMTGRSHTPGSDEVAAAQQAADGQTALLGRVLAVVEAYPQLKANELYLRLQHELADTEDRIALARSFYNDTVLAYNERIGTLPDVLFAKLMGLGRVRPYEIKAFERRPVEVDLSPANQLGSAV